LTIDREPAFPGNIRDSSAGNGSPFDLIDNATSEVNTILEEIQNQKIISADISQPLQKRLEAFEDIFESEVGDTSLLRARNIERETGLRQIFLKFEGSNPTGTQKDRIAFAQVMDAMRRGFDTIVLATCGNYGAAVAFAASLAGLRCLIYIPEIYHTKRIEELIRWGAEIVRTPGDYESSVLISSREAAEKEYYDANPGGINANLQFRAYGEIAYEIYDELRDAPAFVAVAVSNGTTLAGIHKGFVSLYRRGKTSRIPRLVAGSSHSKNPIVQAFLKGRPHCEDLSPVKIRESAVNEPLINWHSADGEHALSSIRQTGGWAGNATDKNMLFYSRMLRQKEGLHVRPASTAGLIAMLDAHQRQPLPSDRYVAVLTGRKE
jgi:threonine synthase